MAQKDPSKHLKQTPWRVVANFDFLKKVGFFPVWAPKAGCCDGHFLVSVMEGSWDGFSSTGRFLGRPPYNKNNNSHSSRTRRLRRRWKGEKINYLCLCVPKSCLGQTNNSTFFPCAHSPVNPESFSCFFSARGKKLFFRGSGNHLWGSFSSSVYDLKHLHTLLYVWSRTREAPLWKGPTPPTTVWEIRSFL